MKRPNTTTSFLAAVLVLAACVAPRTTSPSASPGQTQDEAPRAPKNLVVAVQREPTGLHPDFTSSLTTSGNKQALLIPHNYLVVRNEHWKRVPQLAQDVISIEQGTWRIHADGTMDTTWRLRPNIKWHDGAPFTSSDLLFTFTVYKDPEIPNQAGAAVRSMASAEAPDPLTFVVHWSAINTEADAAPGLIPMPRHLLDDAYRSAKASLINSTVLGLEFVGLGPYQLVQWQPGTQIEFARFEHYYLGRPPLDTITVKFLNDPTTMVAAILAQSVALVLPQGVDLEAAEEVRRRWEGTGNQVRLDSQGALRYLLIQHRPDYARPRNGFANLLVRQAFFRATDRQAIADVGTHGKGLPADSWYPPAHELYAQLRPSIPQYPFDLTFAQQQLAQAGWLRNAQGELVSGSTGERFEIEIRSPTGEAAEQIIAAISEGWRSVGAQTQQNIIPTVLSANAEYRVTLPGVTVTGNIWDMFLSDVLNSRVIAAPENRWAASNRSGYSSSAMDALYGRLAVAIDPADRIEIQRAMLQQALGDVAFIPMYWNVVPVISLRGVRGIGGMVDNSNSWNAFEWNKD
jgi:peptide/nickel transport system substrate-binding protein